MWPTKLYANVVVPSALVWVPTQWPAVSLVSLQSYNLDDKGDEEKLGTVYKSPAYSWRKLQKTLPRRQSEDCVPTLHFKWDQKKARKNKDRKSTSTIEKCYYFIGDNLNLLKIKKETNTTLRKTTISKETSKLYLILIA